MTYKLKDLLEIIHVSTKLSSQEEINAALKIIQEVEDFTSGERDVIRAAFKNGPLDAGDVPSKASNSRLISLRYVSPIVVRGDEGYYALTYKGSTAYRILSFIENSFKSEYKELDEHSKRVLVLNPVIDKCDLGHVFLKLEGHPLNSMNRPMCPICSMNFAKKLNLPDTPVFITVTGKVEHTPHSD